MRLLPVVRSLLGICAVLLLGTALKQIINPQMTYQQGDGFANVMYSHLWSQGCVEVIWSTNQIESIYIDNKGYVGEGQETYCETPIKGGPLVSIKFKTGIVIDYTREMLRQNIETHLWLGLLCLCMVWLWPRSLSVLGFSAILLGGVGLWVSQGAPSLPVATWLNPLLTATALGRVLFLACVIPLFYWIMVPASGRVAFLLGVGILTFLWDRTVPYEYLLVLAVIIVWISALWLEPESLSPPAPQAVLAYSLLLGMLTLGFVVSRGRLGPLDIAVLQKGPLFYGLIVSWLCLWGWWMARNARFRALSGGAVVIGLIFYLLRVPRFFEIAEKLFLMPPLTFVFMSAVALTLIYLALSLGPRFATVHRRFFFNGGLIFILCLFVFMKSRAANVVGWVGFSYIAFRLLHVLLEYRANRPLSAVTPTQLGLYATFFSAQLVGPIDLLPHFAPQMQQEQVFSWNDYGEGWQRVLWGAIKKLYLADILLGTLLPKTIPLTILTPAVAWLQLYVYGFYIYWDFSGFVDIAIGLARLVGYHLPENFDRPYTKGSLALFWQSWHITLSQWIRLYVYLPLSRRLLRTPLKRQTLVIVLIANLVTMILIGLWHGFTSNFIIWGLWHAVGLSLHKAFSDRTRRRQIQWRGTWKATAFHLFSVVLTFHFVLLSWVFFMFTTLPASLQFLGILMGRS